MSQPRSLLKSAARAVADVGSGTILATVEIAAAPERVFGALTESAQLVQWWGDDSLYRTTGWESDLRVGGAWRAHGRDAGGEAFTVGGEFIEIDPPHRLVMSWTPGWEAGLRSTLTYRLEAIEGGTRLTLRHEGFIGYAASCRDHASGWELVLGWLARYAQAAAAVAAARAAAAAAKRAAGARRKYKVAEGKAGTEGQRYFFCRLLPPRPSFAFDMSPEEGAVMHEHANYWRAQMEADKVVVFGPVGDPEGSWSLGVVCAPDEAAVHAFQAQDPALQSGLGFRYEVLPFMQAVVRA